MKRICIYLLAAVWVLSSCQKKFDDTINGQKPDERVAAAMTAYQSKLTSAPYGWIALETTTGTAYNQGVSQDGPVASFAYFLQFNDSSKVTMFSDFDTVMAATPKASDYRLKKLQRPTLIFDTYSYLHVPCDPDPSISLSPFGVGYGWGTDFEFSFGDNVDPAKLGDTIKLFGNLNNASLVMVKATKDQRDAYFAGSLKTTMQNWGKIQNYFKRVTGTATTFEMTPGLSGAKSADVNWLEGTTYKQANSSVYFTATSVNLVTPLTIGTQTIRSFNSLVWNPGLSTLSTNINGTIAATIAGVTAPLRNDPNAPAAWWSKAVNNGNVYWVTIGNFHVNGVDDAYNIAGTVPGYSGFTVFWPRFATSGGINYDLLSPIVNISITFGAAYRPPTFTNGIVIFPLLGTLGTVPAAGQAAYIAMRNKMAEATGYYLVLKEDGTTYDMVNVADAKAWIQWMWVF